jgi:hypothetical protein
MWLPVRKNRLFLNAAQNEVTVNCRRQFTQNTAVAICCSPLQPGKKPVGHKGLVAISFKAVQVDLKNCYAIL